MTNVPTDTRNTGTESASGHGSVRKHIISFAIMILFTVIAFAMVGAGMSPTVVIPVILALAVIQVILQLWDFMHLNQKGHSFPTLFIASGALLGFIFVLVLVLWP
ncbi:MAG: cytochrome C oxidase subunit IV family protein [Kyrpidia tusciae]|nr:cytochrome C oxidase subunit IV family protein [Kyrpidia tusciae]MBE3553251.1 cytochrome C oxidase subunit IV family protein [Kyrpidia tusciae]